MVTRSKKRHLARIWQLLRRDPASTGAGYFRKGRRSGVALVIVMTVVMLMIMLGTELSYSASVQLKLSTNRRDEAAAEGLARSGLNFYRMVLMAAKGANTGFGSQLKQFGLTGDLLWQMVPMINSGLMRMIFVSDGSADQDDVARMDSEGLTEQERAESREDTPGPKHNFLDFDGDFYAQVVDESARVNLANLCAVAVRQNRDCEWADLVTDPIAIQLQALFTGSNQCPRVQAIVTGSSTNPQAEDNAAWLYERNLQWEELVGNLADWIDAGSNQAYRGGLEDSLYDKLPEPYQAKNAAFDTLDEVRLVEGWHRDDVWERFGERLTTYGSGKINVNTAECEVLWALIKSHSDPIASDDLLVAALADIETKRQLVPYGSARVFVNDLTALGITTTPTLASQVATSATVFRVTSGGQVGDAVVTIEAVYDFSTKTPKTLYWKME